MRALPIAVLAFALFAGTQASALPVSTITIDTAKGKRQFKVEVAADPASQEKGLMHRTRMASNAGMLFDLHQPSIVIFWMKDTILPLDIVFIRADGTISSIAANAVPYSQTRIPSGEFVRGVLEINGGLARKLDIMPGDRVHARIFANPAPLHAHR